MSLMDFPLPYLKNVKFCFMPMLQASWAQQGGHRRENCQFHSPAESLPCPPSLNTTFHMKQMRNSAVTSDKYCFGLETFPYRTNFVQTCCILCLKNILEAFVFHFQNLINTFLFLAAFCNHLSARIQSSLKPKY